MPVCVDGCEMFCDRLTANINAFNQVDEKPYHLSMSIGIEHFDAEADLSLEQLLIQADRKMYERKQAKYAGTP